MDCQKLRLVVISDTHSKHSEIKEIPLGDVLIHCGDFTNKGIPLISFTSIDHSIKLKLQVS
jgi:predicted phosphodiesterase